MPFRGTLTALVSSAGRIALDLKGRPVTSLETGRYTIAVSDSSTTAGFTIQEIGHAATTLTGIAYRGKHSVTMRLAAGQWFAYPSFVGKKTYFIVVS